MSLTKIAESVTICHGFATLKTDINTFLDSLYFQSVFRIRFQEGQNGLPKREETKKYYVFGGSDKKIKNKKGRFWYFYTLYFYFLHNFFS